jgi:hypothetical protein
MMGADVVIDYVTRVTGGVIGAVTLGGSPAPKVFLRSGKSVLLHPMTREQPCGQQCCRMHRRSLKGSSATWTFDGRC